MIEKFSNVLLNSMISMNIIDDGKKEIYEYGIYQFLNYTLLGVTLFLLGIILKNLIFVLSFCCALYTMRIFTGGVHLNNNILCYFMSVVIVIGAYQCMFIFRNVDFITLGLMFELFWVIVFFQPYKINRNSIIESCDYKEIARRKRKFLYILNILFLFLLLNKVEILYLPLTLASLANVVSILIDNKLR